MKNDEIELRVCINCDCPLPSSFGKLNSFNINPKICDDCLKMVENEN